MKRRTHGFNRAERHADSLERKLNDFEEKLEAFLKAHGIEEEMLEDREGKEETKDGVNGGSEDKEGKGSA